MSKANRPKVGMRFVAQYESLHEDLLDLTDKDDIDQFADIYGDDGVEKVDVYEYVGTVSVKRDSTFVVRYNDGDKAKAKTTKEKK